MSDDKETTQQEIVQLGALLVAPEAIVERATRVAKALADVIKKQKLSVKIRNKEYVRVEGWSTLGAMIGILPRTVSVTEIDEGIFEATVELIRTTDQAVIGRGIAECGSIDETDKNGNPIWANRPRYARKSMAITRATGKAFRLGLAWIMELAGYSGTPAEEMVFEGEVRDVTPKKKPRKKSKKAKNAEQLTETHITDYRSQAESDPVSIGPTQFWTIGHHFGIDQEQGKAIYNELGNWADALIHVVDKFGGSDEAPKEADSYMKED